MSLQVESLLIIQSSDTGEVKDLALLLVDTILVVYFSKVWSVPDCAQSPVIICSKLKENRPYQICGNNKINSMAMDSSVETTGPNLPLRLMQMRLVSMRQYNWSTRNGATRTRLRPFKRVLYRRARCSAERRLDLLTRDCCTTLVKHYVNINLGYVVSQNVKQNLP